MEKSMSSPEQPKGPEKEAKRPQVPAIADFIERSRQYRFDVEIEFDRPLYMDFPPPEVLG
jgi:hypothetical protein